MLMQLVSMSEKKLNQDTSLYLKVTDSCIKSIVQQNNTSRDIKQQLYDYSL